ncbi:hypothetical protein SNEBB_010310 [Seison nebaliae]|nr:hypothetical protein SNEBB_010310 [Seison nebaliae]
MVVVLLRKLFYFIFYYEIVSIKEYCYFSWYERMFFNRLDLMKHCAETFIIGASIKSIVIFTIFSIILMTVILMLSFLRCFVAFRHSSEDEQEKVEETFIADVTSDIPQPKKHRHFIPSTMSDELVNMKSNLNFPKTADIEMKHSNLGTLANCHTSVLNETSRTSISQDSLDESLTLIGPVKMMERKSENDFKLAKKTSDSSMFTILSTPNRKGKISGFNVPNLNSDDIGDNLMMHPLKVTKGTETCGKGKLFELSDNEGDVPSLLSVGLYKQLTNDRTKNRAHNFSTNQAVNIFSGQTEQNYLNDTNWDKMTTQIQLSRVDKDMGLHRTLSTFLHNSLPHFDYLVDADNRKCGLCQIKFRQLPHLIANPCAHMFCFDCITNQIAIPIPPITEMISSPLLPEQMIVIKKYEASYPTMKLPIQSYDTEAVKIIPWSHVICRPHDRIGLGLIFPIIHRTINNTELCKVCKKKLIAFHEFIKT